MISGALNFTLGLQADSFLRNLNVASGKLLGFVGASASISAAFNKMWASIEQGGKLTDLAASAGVSVKELYQLQRAFEAVGASADSVPAIINRLRRTLATGEQNGLLAQLGLDPNSLAGFDPSKQFMMIAAALSKVGENSRAAAAQAIFGREGAATMQQIANSGNDLADAFARAAGDAAIWDRYANRFDAIADTANEIKGHLNTAWAGFTGGIAPAMQQVMDYLNSIDFGGFGARLGNEISLVFESIKLEKFSQYFELSLKSATHEVSKYMLSQIIDWGIAGEAAMNQAGKNGPGFWSKLGTGSLGVGAGLLGLWNQVGANIGVPGAEEMANKRIQQAYDLFDKIGANDGILMKMSDAFVSGVKGGKNPFAEQLIKLRDDLQQGVDQAFRSETKPNRSSSNDLALNFGKASRAKSDFTDIEKMGGVLLGLGRGFGDDEARMTAQNTQKIAEILKLHTKILSDIAPALKLVGVNL